MDKKAGLTCVLVIEAAGVDHIVYTGPAEIAKEEYKKWRKKLNTFTFVDLPGEYNRALNRNLIGGITVIPEIEYQQAVDRAKLEKEFYLKAQEKAVEAQQTLLDTGRK